ncbi:MAG: hypothetical protein SGPRY_013597 [Prymnesium sp.]
MADVTHMTGKEEQGNRMAKQYNMYNVQTSEAWKQRVSKEANHNVLLIYEDGNHKVSELSDSSRDASREKV